MKGWAAIALALLVAAAEARAPATPPRIEGDPGIFFGPNAYPPDAVRAGEQGRVVARLAIGADGAVAGCTVETSSGSAALDEATCRIATANIRFAPARNAAGAAVAGTYSLPVRWVLPRSGGEPLVALTLSLKMRIAPDRSVTNCAASVNSRPIAVTPASCASYVGLFAGALAQAGGPIEAVVERDQGYGPADLPAAPPPGAIVLTEITTRFQVRADGGAEGCRTEARGRAVVLPVANPCDGRTRFNVAGATMRLPLAARWTTSARYTRAAP